MQKNAFCFRVIFTFHDYTDIFMVCRFFARRWFFFIRFEFKSKLLHIDFRQPGQFFFEHGKIPTGELTSLVVREPIRFYLFVGQIFGNDDGNFFAFELLRGLIARVSGDDYAVAVDNDRLLPAEFFDGRGHGINRAVVIARIVVVRLDFGDFYEFNFHPSILSAGSGRFSIRAVFYPANPTDDSPALPRISSRAGWRERAPNLVQEEPDMKKEAAGARPLTMIL